MVEYMADTEEQKQDDTTKTEEEQKQEDMRKFHKPLEAYDIVHYLVDISNKAYYYGVGVHAAWQNQITDKTVETNSNFHGDPNRFSQGIHSSTVQTTKYSDSYIDFINSILNYDIKDIINKANNNNTDNNVNSINYLYGGSSNINISGSGNNTLIEYTGTDDKPSNKKRTLNVDSFISEETYDSYSKLTDMLAIPSVSEVKKIGPVFVTLDWDVALVDPTEAKPLHKYYNVVEGSRGAYSLIINHACTEICANFSRSAVYTLCAYTGEGSGAINLVRTLTKHKEQVDTKLLDAILVAQEHTALLGHVISRLNRQMMSPIDETTLRVAMVTGLNEKDQTLYKMMMQTHRRFDRLKNRCITSRSKIENTLISSKITEYNIRGPMATVTSITTSLNEAGGTSQVNSATQSTSSEGLIKFASPLKRNVVWPTGVYLPTIYSSDTLVYNRIQIPTTNWDDVKRIYNACPKDVVQCSKSYSFIAEDLYEAVNAFYRSIDDMGIRTASMNYDPVKGRGTYEVNYTYSN